MLRRLDRLHAVPAVGIGLFVGGLVGAMLTLSLHPLAYAASWALLVLAAVLALTAEPVAAETVPEPIPEREHPVDGTILVYVPAGTYTLGADKDLVEFLTAEGLSESLAEATQPVHRVHLKGFWIGKYAVQNRQYRRFLEANPDQAPPEHWQNERFNRDDQPVVGVSWEEARAYCSWAGLELPSEAQWESAARGTDRRRYPWGNEPPDPEHARYGQDWGEGQPSAVDAHPLGAGPYGTLQQAGNVWEWCLDAWDAKAYRERDGETEPVVKGEEGAVRVLRGGAWVDPARILVSAVRIRDRPSIRDINVGFRCVLSFPAEP